MTEVVLFIIVGAVAVAAAVLMLLSENPVHSAMLLIVNFGCIALLYLMLNAPFLAMIQIAIYAGAIMVLFVFVIMLLGAEKLGGQTRLFRWFTPLALVLALAFLGVAYSAITSGKIDLQTPLTGQPMLRVVHGVAGAGPVDVYANSQLIAQNLAESQVSEFKALPPGDYTISFDQPGTQTPVFTGTAKLEALPGKQQNAYTAVAFANGGTPTVDVVQDNLSTVDGRNARLTVINAYTQPVQLVDFGSDSDPNDTKVLVNSLPPGGKVELPPVPENTPLRSWAFTEADKDTNVLFRLNNPERYSIKRDTAALLILVGEKLFNGTVRPLAIPVVDRAQPSFGGPQNVGEMLFTTYMLPFQMVAVLLLAAMIGAIVLTHREEATSPRRRNVRRKVSRPLTSAISGQIGQDIEQPRAPETPTLPEGGTGD
jgi:NADH:ubiquinone oxidoreductase subunit 6 (subunit J)